MNSNDKVVIVSAGHMRLGHLPPVPKHFSLFVFGVEKGMVNFLAIVEDSAQADKACSPFLNIVRHFSIDSKRYFNIPFIQFGFIVIVIQSCLKFWGVSHRFADLWVIFHPSQLRVVHIEQFPFLDHLFKGILTFNSNRFSVFSQQIAETSPCLLVGLSPFHYFLSLVNSLGISHHIGKKSI